MSPASNDHVGVLGARSPVGDAVLEALPPGTAVVRFSRVHREPDRHGTWLLHGETPSAPLPVVISLMPVWAAADHLEQLEAVGCRRLVALSSTSRFTKQDSGRGVDRELSDRLRRGEDDVLRWGEEHGVQVVVLRPTMIYGHPRDGNVSTMRRLLQRFRVFPVVGRAAGLRQPVHVDDVGLATVRAALATSTDAGSRAYTLSGGEVLTYRQLVDRVRRTVPGPTTVLRVPASLFRLVERVAPGSRTARTAAGMADRMSTDMVFDHADAARDLDYAPRGFRP